MFWRLLKTAVFTVIAPYTVGLYLPLRIHWAYTQVSDVTSGPSLPVLIARTSIQLLLTFGGIALYLWCAWDFVSKGFGTPLPLDAPRMLVVKGAYRFVRNPMYVAVLCMIAGQAIIWQSKPILVYLVLVAACFHLFIIAYEEPHLNSTFGGQYVQYCHSVRRWLPRLRPV